MRDRRHSFSSLAPFSIFPLPAEDLADLMMGYLELATTLSGGLMEAAFAEAGIGARVELGDERFRKFADVERGGFRLEIPAPVREQMFMELFTPSAVVTATEELLDELAARPGNQRRGPPPGLCSGARNLGARDMTGSPLACFYAARTPPGTVSDPGSRSPQ
jgi:hypothetical protein